jgi:hypothetical protein
MSAPARGGRLSRRHGRTGCFNIVVVRSAGASRKCRTPLSGIVISGGACCDPGGARAFRDDGRRDNALAFFENYRLSTASVRVM